MTRVVHPLLIGAALCILFSSCGPESEQPLSDPAAAVRDARLEGAWYRDEASGPTWLHFIPDGPAMMDVIQTVQDRQKGVTQVWLLKMFPTVVADQRYMNLKTQLPDNPDMPLARYEASTYWFAKYEISPDGVLTVWHMKKETLEKAIREDKLKGDVSQGVSARITDSSAKIIEYLRAADHAELFEEYGRFRRVKVELPAREPPPKAAAPTPPAAAGPAGAAGPIQQEVKSDVTR